MDLGVGDQTGQFLLLRRRVEPVRVDGHNENRDRDRTQAPRHAAPTVTDVVTVHGTREGNVGVGIEAVHQGAAVEADPVADLEVTARVGSTPEAVLKADRRPVRADGHHSCHSQTRRRLRFQLVVAVAPLGVGDDGGTLGLRLRDAPRRVVCGGSDDGHRPHPIVEKGPLEGLQAA